ncbi:MAG: hypothetical protein P0S96_04285 [Simkaniaceae bacterium]|nr:hypothetical protein [Candidatus Sacchlamyda saccharinae]
MIKNLFKPVFLTISIVSAVLFLSGFEAYRPETPQFVGSIVEPFSEKGVHITAKTYSEKESQSYLDRNLMQVGFRPVQVTIQNNTEDSFTLSSRGIEMDSAKSSEVANSVSRTAIPRSIGFKVAGLFFWPMIIPGTIDSIITFKTHLQMKQDYHAKSIKDEGELLPPYSTVHRVIFLPSGETHEEFTLHLQNQKSNQFTPFTVKINS